MTIKNLQVRCFSIMYSSTMLCLDQFKNSYRMPWLISPHSYINYTERLLQKMEIHVDKYGLQDCINQLDSEQAQTFLAEDIVAVNRLFNSYNDHMQLLRKYCPTDSVATSIASKNELKAAYFNSWIYSSTIKQALYVNDGCKAGKYAYSLCETAMIVGIEQPGRREETVQFASVIGGLIALTYAVLEDYDY